VKAWQFIAEHQPLELNDIPEPTAGPGEAIVDVRAAGICHTDVGFLDGQLSHFLGCCPITLGHEVAGVIIEVGEGVTGYKVGDRVALLATVPGVGVGRNGGFQRRVATSTDVVVPMPGIVKWDQAAVSTDAGTTSYHAVMVSAGVKAGDKVGIIGFGGLGSLGVQIALHAGAQVYVAETKLSLHPKIREMGAADVSTTISDFANVGLDVIIDFAGYGTTTAAAVDTVRPFGRVVQVGLGVQYGTLDLVKLTMNQITLLGSVGGTTEDNAEVLKLMAEGSLKSETELIKFGDVHNGLERLRQGNTAGRLCVMYEDAE
jgi:alcohol dehydrogenase, propanol-preferring